jgi:hypothetical protein
MVTTLCHFQFPDGRFALAQVRVEAPEDAAPVQYAGESDLLPDKFTESEASTLRVWAKRVAKQVGAELTITEAGQYDTWAE